MLDMEIKGLSFFLNGGGIEDKLCMQREDKNRNTDDEKAY